MGLFTLIPVPSFEIDRTTARRAMLAMPWLGLLIGAVAGLLFTGVAQLASPLLAGVLALGVMAAVTGAIHLDGIADTADGLGSRKPAAEALTIMRKSDIGPMGVTALLFVLLIDVTAAVSLPGTWAGGAAIACAAMAGRAAVTVASVSRSSARAKGFGALFVGVTPAWAAAIDVVVAAAVAITLGWLTGGVAGAAAFAAASCGAALVATLWGKHLLQRLGGWTGDLFGSLIETTQATFLVLAALLVGLG